jgi:hypothetical protein
VAESVNPQQVPPSRYNMLQYYSVGICNGAAVSFCGVGTGFVNNVEVNFLIQRVNCDNTKGRTTNPHLNSVVRVTVLLRACSRIFPGLLSVGHPPVRISSRLLL